MHMLSMQRKNQTYSSLYLWLIFAGSRTVEEVLNTDRNIETINAMVKQYKISLEEAKRVYREVRFYTHGIATQLCVNSIKLTDREIKDLIRNNIEINLRRIRKTYMEKKTLGDSLDKETKKILDLGAGTGLELIHVFELFPSAEVTVIDISENMLEELKKRNFAEHVINNYMWRFL